MIKGTPAMTYNGSMRIAMICSLVFRLNRYHEKHVLAIAAAELLEESMQQSSLNVTSG